MIVSFRVRLRFYKFLFLINSFHFMTYFILGPKWVQPKYYFDMLCDYTLVCPIFDMQHSLFLGILRKIPWNFQLNLFNSWGVVAIINFVFNQCSCLRAVPRCNCNYFLNPKGNHSSKFQLIRIITILEG